MIILREIAILITAVWVGGDGKNQYTEVRHDEEKSETLFYDEVLPTRLSAASQTDVHNEAGSEERVEKRETNCASWRAHQSERYWRKDWKQNKADHHWKKDESVQLVGLFTIAKGKQGDGANNWKQTRSKPWHYNATAEKSHETKISFHTASVNACTDQNN